jgi:Ca-activated chloride channel homolog
LSGDAVKAAKAAADAGVRIFTIGVGTAQGSLIPVTGDDGQTAFVKDSSDQVVKSKLDDKRLREIAEAAGGSYLHLENGPRTMRQLYEEGLAKMQAAEMDVRLSRRPIERYEWPLGAALIALALSIWVPERKRTRERSYAATPGRATAAAAMFLMFLSGFAFAAAPGIDAYREGKFEDAYSQFQETLKSHPQSRAEHKLQFDSATAAYKLKDYNNALESFSQALLSKDTVLQGKTYYNLGNTLYQRGETQKTDERKLSDWTNALNDYEQTLKLEPQNREAKDNYDYVKKKIEELKNKQQPQQQPSPSPSPPQKNKQDKQNQKSGSGGQDQQQQQQQQKQQQRQQEQQQQGQGQQQQQNAKQQNEQQSASGGKDQQSQSGKDQKQENKNEQSQAKNEPQQLGEQHKSQSSPSPSPGEQKPNQQQGGEGEQPSPTPDQSGSEMPSPTPGEGEGEGITPSVTPAESPQKKFAGEVKGAGQEKSEEPRDENRQAADAELEKKGQMSERQAEALLESMKDEEARVQLDERKPTRHVYNDW